ncbi:hypothetical protein NGRA_2995 [Nosema granulosis]|uniref:Uncharacterized protein n=1 Tax=Nosema granulosis TaxID=83296 RepID=A0A9P6KXM7_9MICR|nr:hypothetical protein NGRA_2995 [Nosema granulosis]
MFFNISYILLICKVHLQNLDSNDSVKEYKIMNRSVENGKGMVYGYNYPYRSVLSTCIEDTPNSKYDRLDFLRPNLPVNNNYKKLIPKVEPIYYEPTEEEITEPIYYEPTNENSKYDRLDFLRPKLPVNNNYKKLIPKVEPIYEEIPNFYSTYDKLDFFPLNFKVNNIFKKINTNENNTTAEPIYNSPIYDTKKSNIKRDNTYLNDTKINTIKDDTKINTIRDDTKINTIRDDTKINTIRDDTKINTSLDGFSFFMEVMHEIRKEIEFVFHKCNEVVNIEKNEFKRYFKIKFIPIRLKHSNSKDLFFLELKRTLTELLLFVGDCGRDLVFPDEFYHSLIHLYNIVCLKNNIESYLDEERKFISKFNSLETSSIEILNNLLHPKEHISRNLKATNWMLKKIDKNSKKYHHFLTKKFYKLDLISVNVKGKKKMYRARYYILSILMQSIN